MWSHLVFSSSSGIIAGTEADLCGAPCTQTLPRTTVLAAKQCTMCISAEEVTGLDNTYARAQTQPPHQLRHLLERREGKIEMGTSLTSPPMGTRGVALPSRGRQGTPKCVTKTCRTLRSEPCPWRIGEVQSPCPSRGSHQSWRCRRPLEPACVTANTTTTTSI